MGGIVLRPPPRAGPFAYSPAVHTGEIDSVAEEEGFGPSVLPKRDNGFETAPFDGAAAGHRASDLSPGTLPNSARYSGSP